jgi:hypothetical protein
LLISLSHGQVTTNEVYAELQELPLKNLDFARLDLHRSIRQGVPEVIYCPGKTIDQIVAIAYELKQKHAIIIATKATEQVAESVKKLMPEATYYPQAAMLIWGTLPEPADAYARVAVITAGTADGPIAAEASLYLRASGVAVESINDIGVAGLHRLFDVLKVIRDCQACIVIAGMDGVLPSVVAGLVEGPVIAVPTSVGYGASFEGISALLTMLNSCAAGLTVVNIDNGFGAAAAAVRILAVKKGKEL